MRPLAMLVCLSLVAATEVGAQGLGSGCDNCGTVQSITTVDTSQQFTPLGTVAPGSISSANAGTQPGEVSTQYRIGKDGSNQGMVLLGAAGGAAYRRSGDTTVTDRRWQVTVKMDQGGMRVLAQGYEPALHEGDRVHVYGTQLELIQP